MRGPEITPLKEEGVIRIIGLGDSVMLGWGVSYEDTALTKIGQAFENRISKKVETLNLGCPSYNTAIEVATYRQKGTKYQPDVAILIFMENDFGFPGLMLEPVNLFTLKKSYLRGEIRRRLASGYRDASSEEEPLISTRQFDALRKKGKKNIDSRDKWVAQVRQYYEHMTGLNAVDSYLKELGKLFKRDHVTGIVVYNPIKLTAGNPGSREPYAKNVMESAKSAGLFAIDMSPIYESFLIEKGKKSMNELLWVATTDWHPNSSAHGLMAKAVVEFMKKKGFWISWPLTKRGDRQAMKQFWKNKRFFNVTRDQCKDTGMALILILLFVIYFFESEHITIYVIALLILNMVAPWVYRPLAVVWFGFSHLMGTIMSKLILSLIFLVVVTPVGLLRRIFCADTLKLKAFKKGSDSVLEDRNHTFTEQDLFKPY